MNKTAPKTVRQKGRRMSSRTAPTAAASPGHDAKERAQQLSKGVLMDLAREMRIPGRSKMTRPELADAIRMARH